MPVQIEVALPRIEGDTVHFAWTQDAPNSLQHENGFFYRYDNLELVRFSDTLFLEILLAIQLHVWKQQGDAVSIRLPLPMPQGSIDFWRAYHRAEAVCIEPVREGVAYSPWRDQPYRPQQHTFGMHFGGGKDSLATACLAGEVLGRDQVVLLRAHDPISARPEAAQETRARWRRLSLDPLQQIGFATQEYSTNFSAIAVRERYDEVRVGYEKFTVASLPALLAHGAGVSSLGISWPEFGWQPTKEGGRRAQLPRWRPEGLQALSRHFRRALGFDHEVCSLAMLLIDGLTYELLFRRYPDALLLVLACNQGKEERWCHGCPKCFHVARNSLAIGTLTPGFDYDRFFTSEYLEGIFTEIEQTQTLAPDQNAAYLERKRKQVTNPAHYPDLLNVCSRIDPMLAAPLLSDQGLQNLALVMRYFGNTFDPRVSVIPGELIPRLPQPLASQMAAIASEYYPVVSPVTGPFHVAMRVYCYDFATAFPLAIADVVAGS